MKKGGWFSRIKKKWDKMWKNYYRIIRKNPPRFYDDGNNFM